MNFASFAAARGRLAGACVSTVLVSCAPLPDLVQTGCGDRVLASGEDCDGAGKSEGGTSFACIPRDEPGACHFRSIDEECPAGFRAGLDGVCRLPSGTFESGAVLGIAATHAVAVDYDGNGRQDLFLQGENGDEPVLFDGRTPITFGFSFSPYEFATQGAAGDLTGDGLDDVLEPLGASLARSPSRTSRGRRGQAPTTSPTSSRSAPTAPR